MIQRIQTVYLFLAAALTVALLFIPVGFIVGNGVQLYEFNVFTLKDITSRSAS